MNRGGVKLLYGHRLPDGMGDGRSFALSGVTRATCLLLLEVLLGRLIRTLWSEWDAMAG